MSDVHSPGFYWHVHDDVLIGWCDDYQKRSNFIKSSKDSREALTRLRLFRPVKGALPQGFVTARNAIVTARIEIEWTTSPLALAAAREALAAAWPILNTAIQFNRPEIEALHAQECPNCPWNGETIFPKK